MVGQDGEAVDAEAGLLQHHDFAGQHLGQLLIFEVSRANGRAVEHGVEPGEKLLLGAALVGAGLLGFAYTDFQLVAGGGRDGAAQTKSE